MSNDNKGLAMPQAARAAPATQRSRQGVSGKAGIPIAAQIEAWMLANGIRDVRWVPTPDLGIGTYHWSVLLRCGGPSGIGDTVAGALAHARELNAEWLEAA